ncbi:hypothetical protein J5N97_012062 [Dioscorea zingiberensis]|uniref:Bulb-type lectin domain-containing protein n=1 Tax=Dioscorea zingiberensis TaxID=325984 RepID=A0A9D5CN38_9LILI|nr:hypothetical protein J5N97_012062 [Dioscorea zingiberensis]
MLLFLYSLLILQPTSSQTAAAAAAAAQCEIGLDSTLSSTSSWLSPSGRFAFGYYPEEGGGGFNVGILFMESPNKRTVIWTAKIDGKISVSSNTTTIKLVDEGLKLLHANSQGEDQAISTGSFDSPAHCASMRDSGNFIIYDSNSNPLWKTFDYPTDTLMAGQELSIDQELISIISQANHSEGRFRIRMQNDGNLVMYPIGTDDNGDNAYWASNTDHGNYSSVILGTDGILFLSDGNQSRQNLTGGNSNYNPDSTLHLARLEPNGMLYVYAYDLLENTSKVIVGKIPDNECVVKGICGLNSYCTFSQEKQVCLCLPGSDYVNTEDTHAGCQMNIIPNGCSKDDTYYNIMGDLENVWWLLKEPVSPLVTLTNKEDCRDSCLNDCNCGAARYTENEEKCSKHSLPLMFGRKAWDQEEPSVTFIKIAKRRNTSTGLDDVHQTVINKKEFRGVPLTVFVAIVSGLIIFILVFVSIVFRCLVGRNRMIWRSKELALADEIGPRSFSYRELKSMELEADNDEIILSEWVNSCYLAGELEKLTLDEDVNMVEFEKAVKVGLWCIQTDPALRPSMKNVIIMLEGCGEISSPLRP